MRIGTYALQISGEASVSWSELEGHRNNIVMMEYHVRSLLYGEFSDLLRDGHRKSYLERVLKRPNALAFFTGFNRGAFTCPFMAF